MTTLTPPTAPDVAAPAEPEAAVPTAPAPDAPAPAAAVERTCAACGKPMAADQDWCLECGTAAPGRLGRGPGWRTVGSTLALTLVLVAGAAAASYAALSSDATRHAATGATVDGAPIAQVAPAVPAPAAPVITPPPVSVPTSKVPVPPSTSLPKAPTASVPSSTPVVPVAPPVTRTTVTTKPSTPRSSDTAAGSRGSGTAAEPSKPSTTPLTALTLPPNAISLYDPYSRAQSPGDANAAGDGDAKTTFEVSAPGDGKPMQVGLVVDLGSRTQVRGLKVALSTPGVALEVYATDSPTLPPDVVDTRWDHPASRKDAKATERLVFPKGGAKYRYVALWFTQPPSGGPHVGVQELQLLH